MILRFSSASSSPKYVAINTRLNTYTTKPEEVKKGYVMQVACNYFDHIMGEIDFNAFDYVDDLSKPAEVETTPF